MGNTMAWRIPVDVDDILKDDNDNDDNDDNVDNDDDGLDLLNTDNELRSELIRIGIESMMEDDELTGFSNDQESRGSRRRRVEIDDSEL